MFDTHPTITENYFGGMFSLIAFGVQPSYEHFNWSLAPLANKEKAKTDEGTTLSSRLTEIFESHNIRCALAPSPVTFNSAIALRQLLLQPENNMLAGNTCALYRGVFADGVELVGDTTNEAFVMSSADCALIVVRWNNRLWAMHAGRNSLLDIAMINDPSSTPTKEYASVIDSVMSQIPSEHHKEVEVFVGLTISKGSHFVHSINHPEYGESNRNMIAWLACEYSPPPEKGFGDDFWIDGQFSMEWLIREQFKTYGVTDITFDGRCTFSDKDSRGGYLWHSQRREKNKRNLVIVRRNW